MSDLTGRRPVIQITIPWPDKRLSPNARLHYHALARVKKAARHDAWVAE